MNSKNSLVVCLVFLATSAAGQSESFDIATLTPPAGWQRLDSDGTLAFYDYVTGNGVTSFGQIILFPSWSSNKPPMKTFQQEWTNRVAKTTGTKTKPTTQVNKSPDGWTSVTGTAYIPARELSYNCILVTLSGYGKAMSIMVNTAGSDHAAAIENFFNDLNLDTGADNTPTIRSEEPATQRNGITTLNDYDFIPPDGWQVQRQKDQIQLQNMESGCLIQILEPQPSSGNLEQDAKAVFDMMYAGWQYQKAGEQQYTLSKGFLPKGLMYCMMEAPMSATDAEGRYHFQDGVALTIKTGDQIVIVAVRHNSSFLAHSDCERKYETWRRFFNSFTVKNAAATLNTEKESSERIVGVWNLTGGGLALGEYIFAANGNYQFGGALGSSYTTTDYNYEYLHLKTYSFQGDGGYSIEGNQLQLRKRGETNPERVQFRFENVNHGNTGWKDRLYMLKTDSSGSIYEVCYEKTDR